MKKINVDCSGCFWDKRSRHGACQHCIRSYEYSKFKDSFVKDIKDNSGAK